MPDVSVVVDRAARISRFVFALVAGVALVSLFVVVHGDTGAGGGWSGIPGRRLYVVTSGSMSPTIDVGDAVLVKPVDRSRALALSAGDVVTFRAANNPRFLITHRIVTVGESAGGRRFYETKGDANEDRDGSSLDPGRIVGVVTRVIPRLGSVLVAMQDPAVYSTFVVAFLLFELAFVAFRASSAVHGVARRRIPR